MLNFHITSHQRPPASVELDPIVVTASRMAQHNYKIAGNVTVINRRNRSRRRTRKLFPQFFGRSPASLFMIRVPAKPRCWTSAGLATRLHVISSSLLTMAAESTSDISGPPDLVQMPLGAVERIEIIRGAGSVLYGDNAVGGVVNIITKRGRGDFRPDGRNILWQL